MSNVCITIDGPSATGKSTIAKIIAKRLNFVYIDTGAMYRALTWYCLKNNIDYHDEEKVICFIKDIKIDLHLDGEVFCNKINVTKQIRSIEVSDNVSYFSAIKGVRVFLLKVQKEIVKKYSTVIDGRDAGTCIVPNAQVKFFFTADFDTRVERRYCENISKGIKCDKKNIVENIKKRDYIDINRSNSPLIKASDAIVINTSKLSIEQIVNSILRIVEQKIN